MLVCVDVQWQAFLLGVTGQVLEPGTGTCPNGVGGDAHPDPALAQRLELTQILRDALLTKPVESAARIGCVEEDEGDPRFLGGFSRSHRLVEAEVVELADRGVAGGAQLLVDVDVVLSNLSRCQA